MGVNLKNAVTNFMLLVLGFEDNINESRKATAYPKNSRTLTLGTVFVNYK